MIKPLKAEAVIPKRQNVVSIPAVCHSVSLQEDRDAADEAELFQNSLWLLSWHNEPP